MRLKDFHDKGIALKFLAPQYVVVKNCFVSGQPELDIVGVENMIIADSLLKKEQDYQSKLIEHLSGINWLFLAPEIFTDEQYDNMSADIWSVGMIIYCLMTGGIKVERRGNYHEMRDFREEIWYTCDRNARDFVTMMVNRNHEERPTV